MSTCCRWTKDNFWDAKPFNLRSNPCPYQFSSLMTCHHFNQINSELCFTKNDPPSYCDRFWEVREMIWRWNENMWAFFIPSWILCLDESMSIWFQRWTCPGWVFCPRKPHQFGNMNTTLHAVPCLVWWFLSSWSRKKMVRMNWDLQNMMIVEVRLLSYCCKCWRVCFTLVSTLYLTVTSVSFKPLLSWEERVFLLGLWLKSVIIGQHLFLMCTS